MVMAILDGGIAAVVDSANIVPVAACLMVFGIVAANAWGSARKRQIESEERLAAIARGVPVPPTMAELALTRKEPTPDALRRRGNVRMGGIVVTCGAIGIMLFFALIAMILGQREVWTGVACGLIPLGIGVGLLIDAGIQGRELEGQGVGNRE
jgi:NADH:ubiquinone oxidoreductase subunit 6 (subunit J)